MKRRLTKPSRRASLYSFPLATRTYSSSTCHWCHVMERESFESEEIGALLSEHFVSIKVDREERPDVDKVYMTFIQVGGA